jgi:hypothetical protein
MDGERWVRGRGRGRGRGGGENRDARGGRGGRGGGGRSMKFKAGDGLSEEFRITVQRTMAEFRDSDTDCEQPASSLPVLGSDLQSFTEAPFCRPRIPSYPVKFRAHALSLRRKPARPRNKEPRIRGRSLSHCLAQEGDRPRNGGCREGSTSLAAPI